MWSGYYQSWKLFGRENTLYVLDYSNLFFVHLKDKSNYCNLENVKENEKEGKMLR